MTRYEKLQTELNELAKDDIKRLIDVHNDFASDTHSELVYDLAEYIDEKFKTAGELYKAIKLGRVNVDDKLLSYNGAGHVVSFSDIEDDNCTKENNQLD